MARLNVPKRILAWLTLVAVPASLLFVFVEIQREFAESRNLRASVEQSASARQDLLRMLSDYQDIEVGQRGYVVTGDPSFLAPYDQARARIAARFQGSASSDSSVGGLSAIRQLSDQKIQFAERTIDLVANGRQETAERMVAGGEGRRLMDSIRAEIARLDRIEGARLSKLTEARNTSRQTAERLINGALGGLALLLGILAVFIWRTTSLRRAALERIRRLSRRNRAILNSAVDGMLVLDDEGYIREVNPSVTRLFGYTQDELVGMHNTGLMAKPVPFAESLAWLRVVGAAGEEGSGQRQEFIGRRSDRSTLATDVSISRLSDGEEVSYVVVIRDVTERRRIEAMKTEFVSTVSHELRTPLTSIGGSLGLLSAGAAGPLGDKAARLVSIAHSNCERLIRLINDILDIEKIESGKMQFDLRRLPLGPLVDRTVAANQSFGEAHSVTLAVSIPPWPVTIMGDPDRLEQLLTNLVSNAIKHSPEGGTVEVAIDTVNGQARISVLDRGAGIPKAFRTRIFGKFAWADGSDSRRRGGTGLGLTIAKEIAERHSGTLGFADRAGGGTIFTVELPMADCDDTPLQSGGDAGLPVLLHIDDDQDCLSVVASAFAHRAALVSVNSLADARREIARQTFAGVVVDAIVPPDNGLDLVPELKKAVPGIPIVVFTALDDPPDTSDVDAVLVKSRSPIATLVETTMALVARAKREAA